MIEDGALDEPSRRQVKDVALRCLAGGQYFGWVLRAMEIGPALNDAEIMQIVEKVSEDRVYAESLVDPFGSNGDTNPFFEQDVNWVQDNARQIMAGEKSTIQRDSRRRGVR